MHVYTQGQERGSPKAPAALALIPPTKCMFFVDNDAKCRQRFVPNILASSNDIILPRKHAWCLRESVGRDLGRCSTAARRVYVFEMFLC